MKSGFIGSLVGTFRIAILHSRLASVYYILALIMVYKTSGTRNRNCNKSNITKTANKPLNITVSRVLAFLVRSPAKNASIYFYMMAMLDSCYVS